MRTIQHIGCAATRFLRLRRPSLHTALLWCVCSQLAAGAAVVSAKELTIEEKSSVALDGETQIYVKNARGTTIILGREGADRITIRAEKYVKAKNSDEAEEWMWQCRFFLSDHFFSLWLSIRNCALSVLGDPMGRNADKLVILTQTLTREAILELCRVMDREEIRIDPRVTTLLDPASDGDTHGEG